MSTDATLLQRLKKFVLEEANAQWEALEHQWKTPLAQRVAKGWAIEGIRVVEVDNFLVRMHCYNNQSRFREGDLVVLHRGNPRDPDALHLDLYYDGVTDLEAGLIRGNPYLLKAEPDGWVMDQDWFDTSEFYLAAIDQVADSHRGRSIILPILQGNLYPQIDFARYQRAREWSSRKGLNESQVEAIATAYATNLYHLIQGPPGTGKTLMLALLSDLFVQEGGRVLITGLTHRAIHNALNKAVQVNPEIPACKIGDQRHTGDLKAPNFETFDESGFGDIHTGYVIGATPFALQTQRLRNVEFDVVIFDEASQVTIPLALMGMLAGNKYIFVGDEMQLPPVTVFAQPKQEVSSIFSILSGRGQETMLNITYRLNDVLTEWPSKTFYGGKLQPSEQSKNRRLRLLGEPDRWDFVLDPQTPAVFVDLDHKNATNRSMLEAEVVADLVVSLIVRGLSPAEIGVVTPFRAQSRLIRTLLWRMIDDEDIRRQIIVDTVERMQGQEREVVLVSLATSSPSFAAQIADFLFRPQRLNVTVTRPRTKLILVGSKHVLLAGQYDPDVAESVKILRELIDFCAYIPLQGGIF